MAFLKSDTQECDYKALIDKYKDLAFTIALKITNNELDSEEIVQDSFIKAINGLSNYKKESQFSTWFYKIVYHTAISSMRRKKISTVDLDNYSAKKLESNRIESVLERLDESDRKQLISDSLAKLDELDYTILSLYYYEELSLKEISVIVDKKSNYLKVLLQRARLKLLNSLSQSLKDELKELI